MNTQTLHITAITEFKEPTKVDINSVLCKGCRMPHGLDSNGLCGFCRRGNAAPRQGLVRTFFGLFVKDREAVKLPHSVISD